MHEMQCFWRVYIIIILTITQKSYQEETNIKQNEEERWKRSWGIIKSGGLLDKMEPNVAPNTGKLSEWGSNNKFLPARGRRGADQIKGNTYIDPVNTFRERKLQNSNHQNSNFWAARGKKSDTAKDLHDNSFWAARGKKDLAQELNDNSFWAARGKKSDLTKELNDNSFWAARGKKDLIQDLNGNSFWAARGKKSDLTKELNDNSFWAARGKKSNLAKELNDNSFWAARGKKENLIQDLNGNSFWAARGKKSDLTKELNDNSFWAARGKKLNTESMNKNRKRRNTIWNEKRNSDNKLLTMKPRSDNEKGKNGDDTFWPVRGKRFPTGAIIIDDYEGNYDDAEFSKEDQQLWADEWQQNKRNNDDNDYYYYYELPSDYVLNNIIGGNNIKHTPKTHKKELLVNPYYSTEFWSALRG